MCFLSLFMFSGTFLLDLLSLRVAEHKEPKAPYSTCKSLKQINTQCSKNKQTYKTLHGKWVKHSLGKWHRVLSIVKTQCFYWPEQLEFITPSAYLCLSLTLTENQHTKWIKYRVFFKPSPSWLNNADQQARSLGFSTNLPHHVSCHRWLAILVQVHWNAFR